MISQALAASILPIKGTFFDYARQMLSSTMLSQWAVLVVAGIFGVCGNYAYKWLTEQIGGSLWTYLFVDYPKRTALAFCVYIGWTVFITSTGIVGDWTTWGALINLGLTTGFSIDALVNKARRAQWTEEERQAKAP